MLLRFNNSQKYLAFDYETEHLNLKYSRPWQLAYQLYEGQKLLKSKVFFIDLPDFKISKEAAIITRFDINHYNRVKVSPSEVWKDFGPLLLDKSIIPVGHNILGFDVYQGNNLINMIGVKSDWSYINNLIDTLCLARAIALNIPPEKNRAAWMYKLNTIHKVKGLKLSLSAVAKNYGIELDEGRLHDAEYDISINAKVFFKQLYEIEI